MFDFIIQSISDQINMSATFQRKMVEKFVDSSTDYDDKISKEINDRIEKSMMSKEKEKEDTEKDEDSKLEQEKVEESKYENEDSKLEEEKADDTTEDSKYEIEESKLQESSLNQKESFEIEVKPKSKSGSSRKASERKLSKLKISPVIVKPKTINIEADILKKAEQPTKYEHMKNKELREEIKKIDPKFSLSKITTKEALLETLKSLVENK